MSCYAEKGFRCRVSNSEILPYPELFVIYTLFLDRVIDEKHAAINIDGRMRKICRLATNVTDDPEEQVRAEFWVALIDNYGSDFQGIYGKSFTRPVTR